MNANELDKWIENSPYYERDPAVILLRQQQAEIEALKKKLEERHKRNERKSTS